MARRWANYDSFIECKTYGHAWDDGDADAFARLRDPRWKYMVTLRCLRCSTVRTDMLDIEGNVASRRYQYSNGYRDAKGSEKPTRPEMRILLIKRRGVQ